METELETPPYEKDQRVRLAVGRNATVLHVRMGGLRPSDRLKNTRSYCLWIDNWGEEWVAEEEIERGLLPGEDDPEIDWWH